MREPFIEPRLSSQAIIALVRADAMGLLPQNERIEALDLPSLRRAVRHIHRAGIARGIGFNGHGAEHGPALERILQNLNTALEESPAPDCEWKRLAGLLGIDLLARLLDLSTPSVRRYKAATRTTPDDVAIRLHFLTLIVGDLSGAYNEMGIRQWFGRKRTQLSDRAPAELLRRGWKLDAPGPVRVRDLARSLTASPAT